MGDLNGRTAVITGASRGIGRAIAVTLAEAGASLALGARSDRGLNRVVQQITQSGGRAIGQATDVRNSAECTALVDAAVGTFGRIDFLVNNAGIGSFGPIAETSDEAWNSILETNLTGAFYCTRAALRHFLKQRSGHVVNICSAAGREAIAGASAYCVSKFGMAVLGDILSREVASAGVRVTTVYPGRVATAFNRDPEDETAEAERANASTTQDVARAVLAALTAPRSVVHDTIVLFPPPESWDD